MFASLRRRWSILRPISADTIQENVSSGRQSAIEAAMLVVQPVVVLSVREELVAGPPVCGYIIINITVPRIVLRMGKVIATSGREMRLKFPLISLSWRGSKLMVAVLVGIMMRIMVMIAIGMPASVSHVQRVSLIGSLAVSSIGGVGIG
jgi:hypothetical protein